MRTIVYGISAALLIATAASMAKAQTAETAFGVWEHPDNKSHVQIYKCGSGLCAKIVKVVDGQKTDDKNPSPELRKRPIVGLVIMNGAQKTSSSQWKGDLYNRADGATYTGTLTVKSKNALGLQGCTAVVFCKTVTWTRVN
jgi:uncharacterized protein (DUF2147 family)